MTLNELMLQLDALYADLDSRDNRGDYTVEDLAGFQLKTMRILGELMVKLGRLPLSNLNG